jgi:hypothetical protein
MSFDYENYRKESITALGFDPEKLTEAQKDILLEPSEAPENYYCDGEISPAQAKTRWTNRMRQAGFKEIEITKAKRKIGI